MEYLSSAYIMRHYKATKHADQAMAFDKKYSSLVGSNPFDYGRAKGILLYDRGAQLANLKQTRITKVDAKSGPQTGMKTDAKSNISVELSVLGTGVSNLAPAGKDEESRPVQNEVTDHEIAKIANILKSPETNASSQHGDYQTTTKKTDPPPSDQIAQILWYSHQDVSRLHIVSMTVATESLFVGLETLLLDHVNELYNWKDCTVVLCLWAEDANESILLPWLLSNRFKKMGCVANDLVVYERQNPWWSCFYNLKPLFRNLLHCIACCDACDFTQ